MSKTEILSERDIDAVKRWLSSFGRAGDQQNYPLANLTGSYVEALEAEVKTLKEEVTGYRLLYQIDIPLKDQLEKWKTAAARLDEAEKLPQQWRDYGGYRDYGARMTCADELESALRGKKEATTR